MTRLRMAGTHVRILNVMSVRTVSPREGEARERKRFYDSAVWKYTRAAKLRRDPMCQACAAQGTVQQAEHVDHWEPLAKGGHPTADDNLVSLCNSCHSRKTVAEQTGAQMPAIVPSKPRELVFG